MKIVAFVGETFSCYEGDYYTKPTSAAFLQDAFGIDSVVVCSPSVYTAEKPVTASTIVPGNKFHAFPNYSSTKDFVVKCILNPSFFKSYINAADKVISNYKGAYFWIRTPSIGSIIFGIRALKAGEKVLHHMCADASNTWRDAKYSIGERAFGFLMSRLIRHKLKKICQHNNTLNFCTGITLEKFSRKYAPQRTFQFVDVMVKPPESLTENEIQPGLIRLLFVGRVVEDKGIFDLLSVGKRLGNRCHITIVGDGPDLLKARKLVSDLDLAKLVTFTGQLPHMELSSIYNSSDVIVVPSNNHYEGFPRVIMEAWSHKKPVIVADVGGIRAFVRHEINGLIFKPGDVEQLYNSIYKLSSDIEYYNEIKNGSSLMSSQSIQSYWIGLLKNKI